MLKLLILYSHLLATCTALGVIIATDLQLLVRLGKPGLRIDAPGRYVERLITGSLVALYATGGMLIWLGLQDRPDYLLNPKLIGKLMLVGLLTANAFVLHRFVFPRLPQMKPVASWRLSDRLNIALPVALSNSLWMFCAFLGIARPWNFSMPVFNVLGIAALVFGAAFGGILLMLKFASLPHTASSLREYDEHEFLAA